MAKLLTGTRIYGTANVDGALMVGNFYPVNSTSNTTGSLVINGGAGVTGNLYSGALYSNKLSITGNVSIIGSGYGVVFPDGSFQTTAAFGLDQYARTTANSASGNTIITQGVDDTQNTLISNIQGVDATQNTLISNIQGVDLSQNTLISIIQGVDLYQNAWIQTVWNAANSASGTVGYLAWAKANAAYDAANVSLNVAISASANTISIQGVDLTQNTLISNIQGVDVYQNTYIQAAFDTANTKFNSSGGTISGYVTITKDLSVTGNIFVSGNSTIISANSLALNDPLLYLGENNPNNLFDLGLVGSFTSTQYQHTGIVRDHNDGKWKFFSNVVIEPTTTVTFDNNTIYDTLKVGTIEASVANIAGTNLLTYIQASFDTANSASGNTIITQGVDATQNTLISNIQGVDVTQNTLISNIQGVDLSQNTYIQSAWTKANNALANTGTLVRSNPLTQYIIANTANSISNTTGALVVNGGLGVAGNVYIGGTLNVGGNTITTQDSSGNVTITGTLTVSDINVASQLQTLITLANTDYTGVSTTPGTYGDQTHIPVVTIAANGRVTSISTVLTVPSANNANTNGWTGNSVLFANAAGYLSTSPNFAYFSSNNSLSVSGLTTLSYTGFVGSQNAALVIAGSNTKGGIGYVDFLQANNQSAGSANTSKWFRLDSSGQYQIINSSYTTNIFNLTDAGQLTVPNLVLSYGAGGSVTFQDGTVQTTASTSSGKPRVLSLSANSSTPAINTDSYDFVYITNQNTAITSFTTNLTGSPSNGQKLTISITGNTAIPLTWGTSFESSTVIIPSTTVSINRLDVGFIYNVATAKWRCIAVA